MILYSNKYYAHNADTKMLSRLPVKQKFVSNN